MHIMLLRPLDFTGHCVCHVVVHLFQLHWCVSYLLVEKCIVKWRLEAQPCYTFTTKPAPQANLDTSEDVPKKKVFSATEPVLSSSSKKSRVYAISLGVSRVVCIICSLFEFHCLLIYWKLSVLLSELWLIHLVYCRSVHTIGYPFYWYIQLLIFMVKSIYSALLCCG